MAYAHYQNSSFRHAPAQRDASSRNAPLYEAHAHATSTLSTDFSNSPFGSQRRAELLDAHGVGDGADLGLVEAGEDVRGVVLRRGGGVGEKGEEKGEGSGEGKGEGRGWWREFWRWMLGRRRGWGGGGRGREMRLFDERRWRWEYWIPLLDAPLWG
jgi:hypothetical protein